MQQKYVPQKNSRNGRLLREDLVEENPPPYSDLMMTSRGPELRPPPEASQPGHPTIQHRTAPIGQSLQQVAPLVH
ncbi:hypothetical protein E2C01_095829 [Portunus trituberculatus]|uniref:Uncharacterized protein n=1 Tax=Portunus trituberculatus TaxID=210409 RepID=A0A5B7JWD2_PORTR|nr:hypothetical protein [Portunus trituberculatus]